LAREGKIFWKNPLTRFWMAGYFAIQMNSKKTAFFLIPHIRAESEILKNPRLRGIPFVVSFGLSDKSFIIDYHLINSSIYIGMPLKFLRERVHVVSLSPGWVEEIEEEILFYLERWTPLVEARKIGQYYLDLSGMEMIFGSPESICLKILGYLKDKYSFCCQVGLASNRLSSYLASKRGLNHLAAGNPVSLLSGDELEFIRGLSIFFLPDIPRSIKRELYRSYNIEKIGDLGNFSFQEMLALLGRNAPVSSRIRLPRKASLRQCVHLLFNYSRNKASSRIVPRKREKKISGEVLFSVFGREKANHNFFIRGKFYGLLADLCLSMRSANLYPSSFMLSVYYCDDYCFHKEAGLNLECSSNREKELMPYLLPFLEKALERRVALSKVILIFSIRGSSPILQGDLFADTEKLSYLNHTFDHIKNKYGHESIKYACQLDGFNGL